MAEIADRDRRILTGRGSLRLAGRGSLGKIATRVLCYSAATVIALWSVGPFLWQLDASLQNDRFIYFFPPHFVPALDGQLLRHYLILFGGYGSSHHFEHFILISLLVAGSATIVCVTFGSMAAYGLARFKVRGRYGILGGIQGISMFPQIAIVAPLWVIFNALQVFDADMGILGSLILVYLALGLPLVVWVMFGYFREIPAELDEAARIDGAGPIRTLWSVILPISLPSLITTGLISFITAWNEFMFALAFTAGRSSTQTVPVGIANFRLIYAESPGDIAAASVVVTIPLVLLVLTFQRRIISGLTQGAVKE